MLILVVAAGVFFMTYYPERAQNVLIPDIEEIEAADIRISDDSLFAILSVRMKNKGPFRINIDSVDYEIRFDTIRALHKSQDLSLKLSPGRQDTFNLPIAVPLTKILGRIKELQHYDSAHIRSDVRVVYNTVWGRSVLRHKKTSSIAMPVPPVIKMEKVEYAGLENGQIQLLVTLSFQNKGSLNLQVDELSYRIRLADLVTAEGKYGKLMNILPRHTIYETIPVSVELKKPLRAIFLIATNRDVVQYDAEAKAVVSSGEALQSSRITVKRRGTLEMKK